MPLYDYQCRSCGHRLKAKQGINDARLTDCPSCEENQLQRLISQTSFVLKGGGWFDSGYANSPPAAEATSDGASDSGSDSDSGAKPDSGSDSGSQKPDASSDSGSKPDAGSTSGGESPSSG